MSQTRARVSTSVAAAARRRRDAVPSAAPPRSPRVSHVTRIRLEELPPVRPANRRRPVRIIWLQLDGRGRFVPRAVRPPRAPALWGIAIESIALVGGVVMWRSTGSALGLAVAGAAVACAVLLLRHL